MPRTCAFCDSTAKLTGEHIWSDWMGQYFPGQKVFHNWHEDMESPTRRASSWKSQALDWKAKVVCGDCNNGWMSDIENRRAKPAMKDLIAGAVDIPITNSWAEDMAVFAFKTAVILDHLAEGRMRFFRRAVRHHFRDTLQIPDTVQMCLAGYYPKGGGRAASFYYGLPGPQNLELYVLNYYVGRLALQVVAQSELFLQSVSPDAPYKGIAIPFWPRINTGFVWPPENVLLDRKQFEGFATRWKSLQIRKFC